MIERQRDTKRMSAGSARHAVGRKRRFSVGIILLYFVKRIYIKNKDVLHAVGGGQDIRSGTIVDRETEGLI